MKGSCVLHQDLGQHIPQTLKSLMSVSVVTCDVSLLIVFSQVTVEEWHVETTHSYFIAACMPQ